MQSSVQARVCVSECSHMSETRFNCRRTVRCRCTHTELGDQPLHPDSACAVREVAHERPRGNSEPQPSGSRKRNRSHVQCDEHLDLISAVRRSGYRLGSGYGRPTTPCQTRSSCSHQMASTRILFASSSRRRLRRAAVPRLGRVYLGRLGKQHRAVRQVRMHVEMG